ncbi:MAG: nitroreductase family protein, partial [Alistipes sp.]|nr:nitroreductase family protein [Alistipes sp.]
IVESAVYAPFGGATGIPLGELRKIFIFRKGTPAWESLNRIMAGQMRRNSRKLKSVVTLLPFLNNKLGPFARKIDDIARNGIPAMDDAPYIIVVAEKKGFPPVEKQSLAHAMENMWLTATDLDLGFQMISATGTLSSNKEFLNLIEIKGGKYAFDGCAVGCPVREPEVRPVKDAGIFVKLWYAQPSI